MVIIYGSALAPHLEILGYVITGIVAFLMCIQAKQLLLSFVPGTFIGACATFAGQGDWKLVLPSLALGLIFGYAMKNSGLWLAARSAKTAHREQQIKIKREGHSRFRLNRKMPDDNSGFFIYQDSGGTDIWRYFTRMSFCRSALFWKSPAPVVDTIINQENDPCFDSRHQAQHNRFVRGVTHFPFQQALVVNKAENPGLNFIRKYRLTGVHRGEDLTGTHIDDGAGSRQSDRAGIACRHRSQNILPQPRPI